MAGSWSCPHEANEICTRVAGRRCDPGMKGCVLFGRYVFFEEDKNEYLRRKTERARQEGAGREHDEKGGAS